LKTLNEHEAAFVQSFVVKGKRSRYLQKLAHPKRRREILDLLNHSPDFDPAYAIRLPFGHYDAEKVVKLLKEKGAGESAHIIADVSEFDGRELPLREAIGYAIQHVLGIVVSCLPGRLAYYKKRISLRLIC
jgi:hypothetical protein